MGCVVGIDVAQDEVVVVVQPSGTLSRWRNDGQGHAAVVAMLVPLTPDRIVLEGTGGLEQALVAALADAELPTVVANPAQVRSFARGIGRLAKTDPVDAAVLAQFAAQVEPPVRPHADAAARVARAGGCAAAVA
jgi:transposase